MKFSSSLKLNHIFRRLYHTSGKADGYLVLYARKNRSGQNRVGITVSKKLGKAHVRNRTRRRLREVYRLNEEKFQPGWDIVVVARSKAVDAGFDVLVSCFLHLAQKAGILKQEGLKSYFPPLASISAIFPPDFRPVVGFVPLAVHMPLRQSKNTG